MNTPVKFELAKLLKEKGFDLGVINYYSGLNLYIDKFRFNYNDKTIGDSFMHKRNGGCYSAPTISDVVMWLYEKHGIWVNIGFSGDESCYLMVTNKIGEIKWNEKGFKSPIEAYEAAIEYTLNNLL